MAAPHKVAPPARNADRVMDFGFRISDVARSVAPPETCDWPRRSPKSDIRNPKSTLFRPRRIERNCALAGFGIEVHDLVRLGSNHLLIFGKLFEALRIAQSR